MRHKSVFLFFAFTLASFLLIQCTGAPTPETPESVATSATQSAEPAGAATESTDQLITTATPAPTATPGPVTDLVSEVTATIGVEDTTFLGLTVEDWINLGISLVIILAGYLLASWLIQTLLRGVVRRTPIEFDDAFLKAIEPQLRWLAAVISVQIATLRLEFLSAGLKRGLGSLYFVLYLIIGFEIVWRLINYALQWYTEHILAEDEVERLGPVIILARRMGHITLIVIGISMLLTHFGVNIAALTAALGIAGLALSLAAQDTLSDAIAGFTILIDQPFRVGDRIEISDLGTWGDVVEIGTRTTRIRTRDNRLVIVPNGIIGKSQVVNYTFPDPRYRVQMDIGIGYGMDIEKTRRIIVDTVSQVEGVLKDKPVDALYNEMGESAMIFRVRWWIESYEDTRRVFDRVNTVLQRALDEAGIEMPFTTYDVNFKVSAEDAGRMSRAIREPI